MHSPSNARSALVLSASVALALGLAACGGDTDDAATPAPATTASAPAQGATPTSDDTASDDTASDGGGAAQTDGHPGPDADLRTTAMPVSAEDAIATAVAETGDGTVHSVELDHDRRDAAWQWEVKVLVGNVDHDVEIDAVTGTVVDHEQDTTDDVETAIDLAAPMTYDDALAAALAVRDGRLSGWKLESDDDRIAYEFDIVQGSDEEEVVVDVLTGEARLG